jgi:hypothetical protein
MANRKHTAPLGASILKLLDSLGRDLFGFYRPERHYMRGPGPKWREKHAPESHPAAIPLHHSKAAV